ncbi:hypothetical protein [Streptomyces sp. W1SF4]|uniref:hypothetical protein n=1 Tax=Streptomyces sp. W1SF4 TaxID=2305220 RepID=UPI001F497686|nr:hypothetical protein [Streptomyces sp. W1SF4]
MWCRSQASEVGDACREVIDQLLEVNALYRIRAAQWRWACGRSTATAAWRPPARRPSRCGPGFDVLADGRAPHGSLVLPNTCELVQRF